MYTLYRPWEVYFVVTLGIFLSGLSWLRNLQAFALVIFVLLHLLLERPFWLLFPAYASAIHFLIEEYYSQYLLLHLAAPSFLVQFVHTMFTVLYVCSALFWIVLPVPHISKPRGPYSVGTVTYHWKVTQQVKRSYLPTAKDEPLDRLIWVKLYYPCLSTNNAKLAPYFHAPYQVGEWKRRFEEGSIGWVNWHLRTYTKSNCFLNTPLLSPEKEKKYPVVLYVHGQHANPETGSFVCSELASRGFVVCCGYFDDTATWVPGPVKRRVEDCDTIIQLMHALNDNDRENLPEELKQSSSTPSSNMFHNSMNLSGVGIIGHSFGGYTSLLHSCTQEEKVRSKFVCGVGLDNWMTHVHESNVNSHVIKNPYMFLLAELWNSQHKEKIKLVSDMATAPLYEVWFENCLHANFVDIPFLFRSKFGPMLFPRTWITEDDGKTPLLGPVDGKLVLCAASDLTYAFFSRFLPAAEPYKKKSEDGDLSLVIKQYMSLIKNFAVKNQ